MLRFLAAEAVAQRGCVARAVFLGKGAMKATTQPDCLAFWLMSCSSVALFFRSELELFPEVTNAAMF